MPKRRDELAQAHQELRDLRNQVHQVEQPLRERVHELESENRRLRGLAERAEERADAATKAVEALIAYMFFSLKKG